MSKPCIEIVDGTEKCPMSDDYVSKETCSKCFKGTEKQLETIESDVGFIKDKLVGEEGLVTRVSILEAHKKEANRRMVVNLTIATILFTIASTIIANFGKIIGAFSNIPK